MEETWWNMSVEIGDMRASSSTATRVIDKRLEEKKGRDEEGTVREER